ncbi:molybdenum cofactor biosynthesis protein MoaE [soil metagenome]
MRIDIEFTANPIVEPALIPYEEAGALVEFRGLVRATEKERKISALIYEIYETMAHRLIREILEELNSEHPILTAVVIHRYGVVPTGEASIYVRIQSKHRGEAFYVLEHFMNEFKDDVPIWKTGSLS